MKLTDLGRKILGIANSGRKGEAEYTSREPWELTNQEIDEIGKDNFNSSQNGILVDEEIDGIDAELPSDRERGLFKCLEKIVTDIGDKSLNDSMKGVNWADEPGKQFQCFMDGTEGGERSLRADVLDCASMSMRMAEHGSLDQAMKNAGVFSSWIKTRMEDRVYERETPQQEHERMNRGISPRRETARQVDQGAAPQVPDRGEVAGQDQKTREEPLRETRPQPVRRRVRDRGLSR